MISRQIFCCVRETFNLLLYTIPSFDDFRGNFVRFPFASLLKLNFNNIFDTISLGPLHAVLLAIVYWLPADATSEAPSSQTVRFFYQENQQKDIERRHIPNTYFILLKQFVSNPIVNQSSYCCDLHWIAAPLHETSREFVV